MVFCGLVVLLIGLDVNKSIQRIVTGRSMLLLSVLVWYGWEMLIAPEAVRAYGPERYSMAVAAVAAATGTALATYHLGSARWFDAFANRVRRIESPSPIWVLFIFGMGIGLLAMAIFINFRLSAFFEGLTGLQRRWSDPFQRGRYGGLRDAMLELTMFMRAVVPLGGLIILSRRFPNWQRIVAAILIGWILLRATVTGHRSQVLPLMLPLAAAVYWKASDQVRKYLIVVGLPAVILGGYLFSAYVVSGRNEGRIVASDEVEEYVGFEMFRELQYIMQETPEFIPYQKGMTYYVQLVNPIPRFLWPDKPSGDAGLLLAESKGLVDAYGEAVMTNSPGFIGEAYLNFGWFGVIGISAIAGAVVRAWDRLYEASHQSFLIFVVYAGGLSVIFLSGRSFNMSTFYALIALYLLLIGMQWIGDKRFDPKTAPPPVREW